MVNILGLIIPALIPALTDGVKGLAQKLFGGTRPVTVDDQIKLMTAEVEKIKALVEIDKPADNISLWVANLRAAFRYLAAGTIILTTMICLFSPTTVSAELTEVMLQLSSSVFAFMFGDRVYLHLKQK